MERKKCCRRQIVPPLTTCIIPDKRRHSCTSNDTVKRGIRSRGGEKEPDNNKKSLWKDKKKSPLTPVLFFFLLRVFWSFDYDFYFLLFYFDQIQNYPSIDLIITKKNIVKNTKIFLDVNFNFFYFQVYFSRFIMLLKWKMTYLFLINLIMTNKSCENISTSSTVSFKFFNGNNKIMKTLFQWKCFHSRAIPDFQSCFSFC
jgi:hypothetical protein